MGEVLVMHTWPHLRYRACKTMNASDVYTVPLTHDLRQGLRGVSTRLVLRPPLVVATRAHMNLPVILQEVPEELVGPLGWVCGPGALKSTVQAPEQHSTARHPPEHSMAQHGKVHSGAETSGDLAFMHTWACSMAAAGCTILTQ